MADNELSILLKCDYKINLFSSYEIFTLLFKNLFDDFDINLIDSKRDKIKSINMFQTSLMVFDISFSDYEINSKFPESIIIFSSIFYILNSENQIAENDEIKNFKLIVNNDFKNIEKCTQLIKILINKKLN